MNEEIAAKIKATYAQRKALKELKNKSKTKPLPPIDKSKYRNIYITARKNALNRGIDFELSYDDFYEMVQRSKEKCTVSGIAFDFSFKKHGIHRRRPFAPSIDRIDSMKSYSKENCRIVCVIVNMALNSWGDEPFLKMCKAVCRKHAKKKKTACILPSQTKGVSPNLSEPPVFIGRDDLI